MSQTQVQLVGNVTTGGVFAGIVTATAANIGGGAVGINSTGINVSGVVTATTFYGDGSNLSGISINRFLSVGSRVGVVTVTAFAGILTVFGRTSDTNVLV
jgi:hypothetical protein